MVTYAGKLVLAPMVRAGELPTRLLALKHGADLVWSPEIIDKKLIQCTRQVNEILNTVDFVVPSAKEGRASGIVFRTLPAIEQGKLIFQMGTSTPSLAVEAALKVIQDVDGIDVNAGCPKHFSIHAGMGAALLKTPDKLCSILTELVEKVGRPHNKPISVKIRILESEEATLKLVERLCSTGIANLTVHCRTTTTRNREAPIRDYIPPIYRVCKQHKVSLIMNGAIKNRQHFVQLLKDLELPSDIGGMMADCAESNPTVFQEEPLPWYEVAKKYVAIAKQLDHNVGNIKYMMTRIVPGKSKFYQYFIRCKTADEIYYVAERMDDNGEPIEDPTEYLDKCRENERQSKLKANVLKSKKGKCIEQKVDLKGIRGCCVPRENKHSLEQEQEQEQEQDPKKAKN